MKYLVIAVLTVSIMISCENSDSKPLVSNQLEQKDDIYSINKRLKVQVSAGSNGYVLKIQEGSKIIGSDTLKTTFKFQKFEFADWNFDGFNDLIVLDKISSGSGGNGYSVGLYNSDLKKVERWNAVSGKMDVKLDKTQKRIIIGYREGANHEVKDFYRVRKNKLVFEKGMQITRWNDSKGQLWEKTERVRMVEGEAVYSKDSVMRRRP